jgi:hypothetical protein
MHLFPPCIPCMRPFYIADKPIKTPYWDHFSLFKKSLKLLTPMLRVSSQILVDLIHLNAPNHDLPADKPNAERILHSVRHNTRGRVIALDIDKTSCLGNDTNDILLLVSLMSNVFSDSNKKDALERLLTLLVNPEVLNSVSRIRSALNCEPYIVFYTMKGGIVTECLAQKINNEALFLNSRMNVLAFKPGNIGQGAPYLCDQIGANLRDTHPVIYQHLCRVGILTWAISNLLGLNYAAPVYITREPKDMRLISEHLQVDFAKCFLFDDSSDHHATQLQLTKEAAHMIGTQPFDFDTMFPAQKLELYKVLSERFGIDSAFKRQHRTVIGDATLKTAHMVMPSIDHNDKWIQFHIMYPTHPSIEPWHLGSILKMNC